MKKLTFIFIFMLLIINLFIINNFEQNIRNKPWLLATDPFLIRIFSLNNGSRKLLADKLWLSSRYIDEINRRKSVNSDQVFKVYKNIALIDSTLQIATIYGATYLASILERADLGVKLLNFSNLVGEENFQNLFTELILKVVYLKDNNKNELMGLAEKVAKYNKDDEVLKIGQINVTNWANEFIIYLKNIKTENKIKKENREWLKSF
jgi:hypothetical protein